MAESSSVHATSHILPIRPQQCLVIDLAPQAYDSYMFPIMECLKYSQIAPALSRVETVPMELLSQVYATAHYDKAVDRVFFEVSDHKTSISRQRFGTLLGFAADPSRINPETIPIGHLYNMFYNMGYTEVLTSVAKFKKSCLPPQWNGMFTVLFKGLSERSSGSDGSSRLFLSIMYGVYNGVNLDYGFVLWQQLIHSLSSSSRHSEVSYARFWTLITKWAMDKFDVPTAVGASMSSIGTFHTTKIIVSDASKFSFIGSIPETMYGDVPSDSRIIRTIKEFKASGPRELTQEMLKSIHDADKPVNRGKKADKGKQVTKAAKGPSPRKRKPTKAAPSPQPKRRKTQPKRKLIIPSSSSDSEGESLGSDGSQRGETPPRGNTPPRSPTPDMEIHISPIPSPTQTIPTSIPTITPTTTIPSTSFPIPPPIFTDTTTTATAKVTTNVSDTGVHTDATETPPVTEPTHTTETQHTTEPIHTQPPPDTTPTNTQPKPTHTTTPPASPPPTSPGHASEGDNPFLGGENMTFDSVYFSPFQVQSDDENDAPVTKKHLKELNEKVDLLLASSSNTQSSLSKAALQKIVDAFSRAQHDSVASATAAIDVSTKACEVATAKVDKLFSEASSLLKSFQENADATKTTLEPIVQQLATFVSTELKSSATLRQSISDDNSALRTSIDERLAKLQEDLAAENSLMDVLANKTTALKVKSAHLSNSQQQIEALRSEREVIKTCVSDVHSSLSNILEAHDPILNHSVRRTLAEKLAPALDLLSKIEGLPSFVSDPKQGGEVKSGSKPPPSSKAAHTTEPPPTGQTPGSGVKDKGKKIAEEEDDDDKETIADLLKRKNSRNVDNDNIRVAREAEEAKRKKKEAHDLLESRKTLFPAWTRERMIKEAIDTPSILWLEPVISFDCYNSVDSQFDMPLTRKAFIFHAFSNIFEVPHPNPEVDRELIDFYLKAAQPQYQTWSAQKIVNVRVLKPYTEGRFINVRFRVIRGSARTEHLISLADLPSLNPHDWIVLHNILLTNEAEYGPVIDHLKRMLVCYIMEVALMDQEVATVFKKKPKISLVGSASDLNQMKMGKIDPKRNSVMFTRAEGQKCLFALADKHLYTTACLEHVLSIIRQCKENAADDIKYFNDMIQWYIRFKQTILALISRLFQTVKKKVPVVAAGPS
ncbi:hypothetical protein Lser_V15G01055 [Lactuca serriola]